MSGTPEKCGQIHVAPGDDGMGNETPCANVAAFELGQGSDWRVCVACLAALKKEGIEEADDPRPLPEHA